MLILHILQLRFGRELRGRSVGPPILLKLGYPSADPAWEELDRWPGWTGRENPKEAESRIPSTPRWERERERVTAVQVRFIGHDSCSSLLSKLLLQNDPEPVTDSDHRLT